MMALLLILLLASPVEAQMRPTDPPLSDLAYWKGLHQCTGSGLPMLSPSNGGVGDWTDLIPDTHCFEVRRRKRNPGCPEMGPGGIVYEPPCEIIFDKFCVKGRLKEYHE